MNAGFRPLMNPATPVHEIDLRGTQAERRRVRDEWKLRQAAAEFLVDISHKPTERRLDRAEPS